MRSYLLRSEGVNFDATIYDTNDLSTIRGASLALLSINEPIEVVLTKHASVRDVKLVFAGASQCAFQFVSDLDEAALAAILLPAVAAALSDWPKDGFARARWRRQPVAPYAFLNVVSDIVVLAGTDDNAIKDAHARATARNRAHQFRAWTVDRIAFDPAAKDGGVGFLDPVRPRSVPIPLPRGKVLPTGDDGDDSREGDQISASLAARRLYGRRARQDFYLKELARFGSGGGSLADRGAELIGNGGNRLSFADSFEDIVSDGPKPLPLSVGGKIAVIYADGNRFSAIREPAGVKAFSEALGALRAQLLLGVLAWFAAGAKGKTTGRRFAVEEGGWKGLRLETLLWGGDEFTFVVPAWLALDFTGELLRLARGWQINGATLTHSFGVAIAHHKTPIRQLHAIAKKAADLAKDAGLRDKDSVSFEIFESLAPPEVDSAGHPALHAGRVAAYGEPDANTIARLLAVPGADYEDWLARLRVLTADDGFPRSQIYKALRRAAEGDGTLLGNAVAAEQALDDYRKALGAEAVDLLATNALPFFEGAGGRPKVLELAQIAQIWDYAAPTQGAAA